MNNEATFLDGKAKRFAKEWLRNEAHILETLSEMRAKRVFAELNYKGIFDYCVEALKLANAQAYYFKSVAEKSEEVPQLAKAVKAGELSLSQARRIAPILTQENQAEWIEKAKTLPQPMLEREVTAVNPKAHVKEKIRPVAKEISEMKVAVNAVTEENLKVMRDLLAQKKGRQVSLAEVIEWMSEICREKFDPIRKAARSKPKTISLDPEAGNATLGMSSLGNEKPGRKPVVASVKHAVVKRDQNRCTYESDDGRRCTQTRWLHLHHIKEVSEGGLNLPDNLRTLCQAHHGLQHVTELGRGL